LRWQPFSPRCFSRNLPSFQLYHDEGYVLLSLDHYLQGGSLYTEVFSQYGPFYFYAYNAELAKFWGPPSAELVTLPLARYVMHDMPKVAERNGYEISVHPRRDSPWVEAAAYPSPEPRENR
jgi:hypothetical protein